MRKLKATFLLVAMLLGSVPVKPPAIVAPTVNVTRAEYLPGYMWMIYAGIAYTTALFWYAVSEMTCGDCAFRGHGAGGSF
jgi:hypothetical protein